MDTRHNNALRRLAQADQRLQDDGHEPDPFTLHYPSAGRREIRHRRWDSSWATPSEHDIDDLEELGYVRVLNADGKRRYFVLTMKGQAHGRALDEAVSFPVSAGTGRAPSVEVVLDWLVDAVEKAPEILDVPSGIVERAIADGLVDHSGREAFARRVQQLAAEGYLAGAFVDLDQISAEQALARAHDLQLTVKAYEARRRRAESAPRAINVYGNIVNSQVAAGSISNTTTFISILARAEVEIDALDGIDPETKDQAKGLIRTMLGKSADVGGQVVTGAAGSLAAAVLGKLLGLPLG